MNLQEIMMAIIESNSQHNESPIENINKMSNKLKKQISEYEKLEKIKKQGQQKYLLEAFFKVLDYIGAQLQEVKDKYENIDKQQMKLDKQISLAQDIKIFREQCFFLRGRLREAKLQLNKIKIQNDLLEDEQGLLQKVYEKKSKLKDDIKHKTLSQFWNKQKTNKKQQFDKPEPIKQRQTQFEFREQIVPKNSSPQSYFSQNRLNRLISTSQQPRRNGKSLQFTRISLKKGDNNKNLKLFEAQEQF